MWILIKTTKNHVLFEQLRKEGRYIVPSKYIRGYVDTETKRFILNPQFHPDPLKKPDNTVDPLPVLKSRKAATPHPIVATPISVISSKDEDIW